MPTLSKQLIAFAVLSIGLSGWSASTIEVIKFSTGTLIQSADQLIDRTQMTPDESARLDRTFQQIVSNDRAWQRIARTQPVSLFGFAFLAIAFGYAAWAVRRLEVKLGASSANR